MTVDAGAIASAAEGAAGAAVLLSANPVHDTGGGQRSAQLAFELLERGWVVVFVSHGRVTETVDLRLDLDHPRLIRLPLPSLSGGDALDAVRSVFGGRDGFVLTQVPVAAWEPVVEACRAEGAVVVYDCIDRWDSELGRGWYRAEVERRLARDADVLTASAPALVEHVERLAGQRTQLLPNAFNARVFDSGTERTRPADLPVGRPLAIYVGALWGGWMDWSLVDRLARADRDASLVFVGDHRSEGRGLPDNCSFLGLKAQAALPAYLAAADLALIPWSADDVTHATSPLKVYEFVAMGLPVVAPDIEPLRGIPGVTLCADADAFGRAFDAVRRSELDEATRAAMRDFSAANAWSVRVDHLLSTVADARRASEGRTRTSAGHSGSRAVASRSSVRSGATISVVMAAYNHERFVGEAIDGVRAQTLPAAEMIVVDDGSADRTREVIAAHAFSEMTVVEQENRGAHRALNRAIALSRGEYVAILNSDDVFEPTRLEHAWGVARATGAALVCGAVRLIDERGEAPDPDHDIAVWYAEARRWARAGRPLPELIRRHNVAVTTSNFFLHRELWNRLGGFAAYRYVHDYDFLLRAVELCGDRVVYVDELEDVRYRVHGDNTISESRARADEERRAMMSALRSPRARLGRLRVRLRDRRAVSAAVDRTEALGPVTRGAPPDDRIRLGLVVGSLGTGGLEEVVALLAQALPSVGVDTTVLCTHGGGAVAERLRGAGIAVHVADGRAEAWRDWSRGEDVDAVSSHFAPVAAVRALAQSGTPVVETVQNVYAWFTDADWEVEQHRVEAVQATIAVSEGVASYYELGTGHRPEWVVPNVVHPGRVARVPRTWARARMGLDDDDVVFTFVGRIAVQKNPTGLLRAFERARQREPRARLLLVGPAEGGPSIAALRRAHRALFATGAVRHLDTVADVGEVLSASDAFVSNSFHEGWSVAASEAAWVGLPLLLSDTGGSEELVGTGGERGVLVPNPAGDPLGIDKASLIDPDPEARERNEAAMADAIVAVSRDRESWRARAPEIRAQIRALVAPEVVATRYADVFRSVVSGARTE